MQPNLMKSMSGSAEVDRYSKEALVLVDLQRDYCCRGGSLERQGNDMTAIEEMLPRAAWLIDRARELGILVIHVRMVAWPWSSSAGFEDRYRRRGAAGPSCVHGTWGSEPIFEAREGEPILQKERFSGFTGTALDSVLRRHGTRRIAFAGVTTSVCVESSVRNAFELDYQVAVVADCVAMPSNRCDEHEASLKQMETYFAELRDSESVWAG